MHVGLLDDVLGTVLPQTEVAWEGVVDYLVPSLAVSYRLASFVLRPIKEVVLVGVDGHGRALWACDLCPLVQVVDRLILRYDRFVVLTELSDSLNVYITV